MTTLITCLSKGYGQHVLSLIRAHDWDTVFIVTSIKVDVPEGVGLILVDENQALQQLVESISQGIKGVSGFEIAVNLTAGSGKEHMAILSAVLKQGLAVRLVDVGDEGIVEI